MGIEVPTHDLDHSRIAEALESFAGADCPRALTRIIDGSEFLPKCSPGRLDLFLVGQYMETWETTPYWDIILRGGMPAYSLCLHELAEIEWYFRRYNTNGCLDPYDKQPKERRPGEFSFDQQEGYDDAHAWALLVEHRYIQRRAREEGEDFPLKGLVLRNPHGWDGKVHMDNHPDWICLSDKYGSRLADVDKRITSDTLGSIRAWYKRHGYRRPQ